MVCLNKVQRVLNASARLVSRAALLSCYTLLARGAPTTGQITGQSIAVDVQDHLREVASLFARANFS